MEVSQDSEDRVLNVDESVKIIVQCDLIYSIGKSLDLQDLSNISRTCKLASKCLNPISCWFRYRDLKMFNGFGLVKLYNEFGRREKRDESQFWNSVTNVFYGWIETPDSRHDYSNAKSDIIQGFFTDTDFCSSHEGLVCKAISNLQKSLLDTLDEACSLDDLERVKFIINCGIEPHQRHFLEAISSGYEDIYKYLKHWFEDSLPFIVCDIQRYGKGSILGLAVSTNKHLGIISDLLANNVPASETGLRSMLLGIDSTALYISISTNWKDCTKLLLSMGADVDLKTDSTRYVRRAISTSNKEMVELLLEHDPEVVLLKRGNILNIAWSQIEFVILDYLLQFAQEHKYSFGETFTFEDMLVIDFKNSIIRAAKLGYINMVKLFMTDCTRVSGDLIREVIQHSVINEHNAILEFLLEPQICSQYEEGYIPRCIFGMAVKYGRVKLVKQLLDDSRVHPEDLNKSEVSKQEYAWHYDVIKVLLEDGRADPGAGDNIVIKVAAELGEVELVKLLLADKRVNPGARNNDAIMVAARNGHAKVVELLLEDRRVDPRTDNSIALQLAAEEGHLDVVRVLLADGRAQPEADENITLRLAVYNGFTDIVALLVEDPRVSPEAKDNYAIKLAAAKGYADIVVLLLNSPKVSPGAEDNYAIKLAAQKGFAKIVALLLEDSRVHPEAEDNFAIKIAAQNGFANIVKLLLDDKRVNPLSQVDYVNAVQLASENGHKLIEKLLFYRQDDDSQDDDSTSI